MSRVLTILTSEISSQECARTLPYPNEESVDLDTTSLWNEPEISLWIWKQRNYSHVICWSQTTTTERLIYVLIKYLVTMPGNTIYGYKHLLLWDLIMWITNLFHKSSFYRKGSVVDF